MKRLVEGPLSDRARSLLASAASDVPPRREVEKARLVSVASAGLGAREARSSLVSAKWLGLLSLLVATTGLVGGYCFSSSAPAAHEAAVVASPPVAPVASAPVEVAAPSLPAAPPPPSIDVAALPSKAEARLARAKAVSAPSSEPRAEPVVAAAAAPAHGAARLEDELAAVDEARAAFVEHQPALALTRVASYRSRFPSGHFSAEIDALEIQSLASLHRSGEAREKAERFLSAHPSSPYAQRVRSAVGIKQ